MKGIVSFVEYLNRNKGVLHDNPIYMSGKRDNMEVEVALQYNDTYIEKVLSFANNINTEEGGTHLVGFRTALTRTFNDYIRKMNLLKESDPNLAGEDVREGLTAVISVKLENPQFEGQTKTKLGNSEMRGLVDSIVGEGLSRFLEENPSTARAIAEKAISASRAREAARKARELPAGKTSWSGPPCPANWPTAANGTRGCASCSSWREILPAAPQNRAGTRGYRRYCP